MMCGECTPIQAQTDQAIDPSNFDNTVSPADNFFKYCNGGWQSKNPIPPEYPNWNTFLELHTQNQERLKTLLGELTAASDGESKSSALEGEARLVSIFYNAALDETAVEASGHVEPLAPVMAMCQAANQPADRARVLGELVANFGLSFFERGQEEL